VRWRLRLIVTWEWARSAICHGGERRGSLHSWRCTDRYRTFQRDTGALNTIDLGVAVIQELIARTRVDGAEIDEVLWAMSLQAGLGQNPARPGRHQSGPPGKHSLLHGEQGLRLGT